MKLLLLLTLLSTPAFAHFVNYDSKAYLDVAKGNQESANYIAHFCSLSAESVDDCMSRLLTNKGEIAAEKCGREIHEISVEIFKELHLSGSIPGKPDSGYPHLNYSFTKEEGWHRYGYTDGAREISAVKSGTDFVRLARENAVKQQETDKSSKDVTGGVKGALEGSAGMLGTEVKTSLEGSAENTTSSEKSTVKGGLTEFQIAKAYNAGFVKGWNDPWKQNMYPDIVFKKGETSAVGSDGKTYKNDLNQLVPPVPKDQLKDEGPVSVSKPKEDEKPKFGPLHPTSPIFSTPAPKKGASLDVSNDSWADIQKSNSGDLTPIQACYELEMYKIKKKESVTKIEGDEFTYAQQKNEAEQKLSIGICQESFYGKTFCDDWRFKQSLNIDQTPVQPIPNSEQPFEEFSSWQPPEMSAIPEVGLGCIVDCPIEVQP